MLKLTEIRKAYKTIDFTQTALDGVSVSFRNNEFAAILGPSGSGKTTMLNIIGGLDHYDSGDLEIDGISTKKYKSSDWDTYRNNRIGFVFQSYNLIPHQTILANVELALTLSGVSSAERKERAAKALSDVGLGEHIRKLPSQLSGGQMQRVAIARALINDPEILLADEPTGALDTKTSKQVMELLRQIAKERLVIMVTHNPELADEYANRIIRLHDGQLIDDTNPLDPEQEEQRPGAEPRKVSMSLLTAISLSLSNLMTKKGRTFVVSLAGSIGIIGIAAILALASGINAYIENIEEETMSIYPLTIQESGIDFNSLLASVGQGAETTEDDKGQEGKNQKAERIEERKIVESLFQSKNKNDLKSLKTYIDENETKINPYVKTIQYVYDITPQIYLSDTGEGVEQISPDTLLSSYGIGAGNAMASMFGGSASGMNVFHELPGASDMYDYQYEMKAGRWPASYDETVLVLMPDGSITDYTLYAMGLRDRKELKDMLSDLFTNPDKEAKIENDDMNLTYQDLMAAKFKVVSAAERYQYDDKYGVWVDRSDNDAYMKKVVAEGIDLKIVGVVQPDPDATATSLSAGINYTPELIPYLMKTAAASDIVRQQLQNPEINVLTAKTFAEEKEEDSQSGFNFSDLFTIDENKVKDAFQIDESKINLDFSGLGDISGMDLSGLDLSGLDLSGLDLSGMDLSGLDLSGIDLSGMDDLSIDMSEMDLPELDLSELTGALAGQINIPTDALNAIMVQVLQDFLADQIAQGITDPAQISANLRDYLNKPEVQAQIAGQIAQLIDPSQLESQINEVIRQYMQTTLQAYMEQVMASVQSQIQSQMQSQITKMQALLVSQLQAQIQSALENQMKQLVGQLQTQIQSTLENQMSQLGKQLQSQIQSQMEGAMQKLPEQLQKAISIDQNAFAAAFQVNMSENEIMELMKTMMNKEESTYENNLKKLGYATADNPLQINFYPKNFSAKSEVADFLQAYNDRMEKSGDGEKKVNYTDLVGTMMSSVTDIVDTVSYALIAFVGISLVVSSIMIGVITYISVLERKKEIGILRAIGASKRDVRRVFNAETLIIGFVAGLLGVGVTYLISIVANIIVYEKLGIRDIARLPVNAALILIGISMLLAFISGLFPASAAARKDPVEALRSE
ncbi:ABC transporter ATP-binding protein/permease [Novisyntrophococcus fermenticellae]|uniref:ABC transporter ATP-binding protein/permease n=1 Tax=Novisyntrophococcus fermenticellae TaxID=2068655 RepID=UPI001E4347D1|nr:ABC transporter ATP-binding protein/permease [Novisyntrophococcus fermenticellae]